MRMYVVFMYVQYVCMRIMYICTVCLYVYLNEWRSVRVCICMYVYFNEWRSNMYVCMYACDHGIRYLASGLADLLSLLLRKKHWQSCSRNLDAVIMYAYVCMYVN